MSGGTKASLVGAISEPAFGLRDGRVQTERGAKRVRSFKVGSKQLQGVSVGSSEHFALPRVAPRLREVNAYLGWFGPASRAMQVMSAGTSVAMKVPGVDKLWSAAGERFVQGSTGGPDADARSKSGSHVVAIAYDAAGRALSEVHVKGVDGYTFTGRMLAWGAERVAAGGLKGTGALGPVDAFGLDELVKGCAEAGISEQGAGAGARPTFQQLVGLTDEFVDRCVRRTTSRSPAPSRRRRLAALGAVAGVALIAGVSVGSGAGDPAERSTAEPARERARERAALRQVDRLSLRQRVGQVTVSSFPGTAMPEYIRRRLRARETAGVILFGSNGGDRALWRRLTRSLQSAAGGRALVMVDQEGGDIRTVEYAGPAASQPFQGVPSSVRRAAAGAGAAAARRPGSR